MSEETIQTAATSQAAPNHIADAEAVIAEALTHVRDKSKHAAVRQALDLLAAGEHWPDVLTATGLTWPYVHGLRINIEQLNAIVNLAEQSGAEYRKKRLMAHIDSRACKVQKLYTRRTKIVQGEEIVETTEVEAPPSDRLAEFLAKHLHPEQYGQAGQAVNNVLVQVMQSGTVDVAGKRAVTFNQTSDD